MENDIENIDSSNDETTGGEQPTVAPKEDLEKLKETNRQLFERAKRAETEAKEYREKIKALATPKEEVKPSESQPANIDNDRIARLELQVGGVSHPDDQKLVLDEAKRLNLSPAEVASMEYMQSKLKTAKEAREAQDGLPSGSRRAGGLTQHDVEYYLANPDKRPDSQELAEKVLAAKMEAHKKANTFSDTMFV